MTLSSQRRKTTRSHGGAILSSQQDADQFIPESDTGFATGDARQFTQIRTDQEEPDQEEDSNQVAPDEKNRDEKPPYSPYIAGVVLDFSRELGDAVHGVSNVTQALRLHAAAGRPEQEFVDLLYEARRRTRQYQGRQGLGMIENKMAYFFSVMRNLSEGKQNGSCTYDP
jgi:hypothetical protein